MKFEELRRRHIKLADFTTTPGPRYRSDGEFSGQQWREDHLAPAVEAASQELCFLEVDLDGVDGFATSFVEEAFGGLVRDGTIDVGSLVALLEIKCDDEPGIVKRIFGTYILAQAPQE